MLKDEQISVIRGKAFQTRTISVWDLVVGDVILLDSGDRVPADCIIIQQENIKVDVPADSAADLSTSRISG